MVVVRLVAAVVVLGAIASYGLAVASVYAIRAVFARFRTERES